MNRSLMEMSVQTYIVPFARGLSDPLLLSSEVYFSRERGKWPCRAALPSYNLSIVAPDAFTFSVTELRLLTILQQIPFVIPFDTRVQVSVRLCFSAGKLSIALLGFKSINPAE